MLNLLTYFVRNGLKPGASGLHPYLAIQEASSSKPVGQIVCKILSQKTIQKKGLVEWLKV
jgi:hypothetical protein